MKRIVGMLMALGLLMSVMGCGSDNPTSSIDLIVGTWIADDADGHSWTYHSDGTLTNYDAELEEDGVDGPLVSWSINGDNLIWSRGRGDPVIWTFSVTDESLTISTTTDGEEEAITRTFTRKK